MKKGEQREVKELARNQVASSSTYAMHCATTNQGACDSQVYVSYAALPIKVCIVKAMLFPVVIYGCQSWTVKKAELQRIDAFELRCWRRLLWVPWTARRSNQSILKEIKPEYSLEGLMLKLQYFRYLMQRAISLEKTLMLGKTSGQEEKKPAEDEMVGWHRWLNGHEFEQTPGDGEGQGSLACCSSCGQRDTI